MIYALINGRPPPALLVIATVSLFPVHAKSVRPDGDDVKLSFLPSLR